MDHLGDLIQRNRGYVTRRQALELGETDQTLHAALRSGTLFRVRHGVYAPRASFVELDDRARHLLRVRASLAQQKGGAALAGPSAALFCGFDVFGHDLDVVHLARLDAGASRRQAGAVHHRLTPQALERVRLVDGVAVVSPADAVWQTALLSSLEGGVVTADSALHQDPRLVIPLRVLASEGARQARSRTARLALKLSRPESESVGESLTRVACFRHGIPCPSLQHDVFDLDGSFVGRTDFYWEPARLLGEFDGKIKYTRLRKEGQSADDVVVAEKRREDVMRSTRCGMTRFTWFEVQPDVAARRMVKLRHELDQAHRLYVWVTP